MEKKYFGNILTNITYLLSPVKNHVSDEEYKATEKIVQQFLDGDGPILQKKLVEKAEVERNWVIPEIQDIALIFWE